MVTDIAIGVAQTHKPLSESLLVRLVLIGTALGFIGLMIVLPLVVVFTEALRQGIETYFVSIVEPDALAAIRLTLLTASIAVPVNIVFGLVASWAIAKHEFCQIPKIYISQVGFCIFDYNSLFR